MPIQETLMLEKILATVPGNIMVINTRSREVVYYNAGPEYWGFNWKGDGKKLYELIKQRVHRDERDKMTNLIERIHKATDQDIIEENIRFVDAGGRTTWIYLRNKVFRRNEEGEVLEFLSILYDISAQKATEEALKKNQALHNAILNALPDLKFHLDKEGIILDYYSSGFDVDLLMSPDEFIGKSVMEVLPPPVAAASLSNIKKAMQTKQVHAYEYFLVMGDEINFFEGRCCAVNEEEAVVVVRNITERKKTYESLQAKIRELDAKNRELAGYVASNAALENFAYVASHDLREPLRTMRTYAQLMQKRYAAQLDEKGATYLDFISSGANNLNQLIEDLLEYAKVNAEPTAVSDENPAELIDEVIQNLTEYITRHCASIVIERLPGRINVNATKFKQLVQNMVINAIKFSKPNVAPEVKIMCEETPTHWQFAIEDNGIGVDPEFQVKIFELFKKLHPLGQFEGTGLGLAICKKIVEQHQGKIWVKSNPGEGAVFYFTIGKSTGQ